MTPARAEAKAFDYIINLIYERCRIRLHEGKHNLIRSRLGKRMRHLGIDSLEEYCDFLQSGADEEEFTQVVDALTTNFTNFLREQDHFEFMVSTALPEVISKDRPFSIWSSACATGEEPYSIAFYLEEHFATSAGWEWSVLATDISTRALGKAETGIYPLERAGSVPEPWLKKYCQRGVGDWEGHFRIKPHIADRVSFQQINLLSGFSFSQPFDLIFCRNVMIYFDRETQEQLVNELARQLVPGGYLLVGHSESLNGFNIPLKCVKPSIYQKN